MVFQRVNLDLTLDFPLLLSLDSLWLLPFLKNWGRINRMNHCGKYTWDCRHVVFREWERWLRWSKISNDSASNPIIFPFMSHHYQQKHKNTIQKDSPHHNVCPHPLKNKYPFYWYWQAKMKKMFLCSLSHNHAHKKSREMRKMIRAIRCLSLTLRWDFRVSLVASGFDCWIWLVITIWY